MSLSRRTSTSELPEFGRNNSSGDIHFHLHQSKSAPLIAFTNTDTAIISNSGSYIALKNNTYGQSLSTWGHQLKDTESDRSNKEIHRIFIESIDSLTCEPQPLLLVDNHKSIRSDPCVSSLEYSVEPGVSGERHKDENESAENEDDYLEMASNDQSMTLRRLVAGQDSAGLVELTEDVHLEYGSVAYRGRGFFHPGRLIGVYFPADSSINDRTMIVLSVSNHGFVQCVALCRHGDHTGEEHQSFYQTHAVVQCDTDSPSKTKHLKTIKASFELTLNKQGAKIKDSCYINFEHTWTLQSEVPVVDLGHVKKAQRKDLLLMHESVQSELRNRTLEGYGLQ